MYYTQWFFLQTRKMNLLVAIVSAALAYLRIWQYLVSTTYSDVAATAGFFVSNSVRI